MDPFLIRITIDLFVTGFEIGDFRNEFTFCFLLLRIGLCSFGWYSLGASVILCVRRKPNPFVAAYKRVPIDFDIKRISFVVDSIGVSIGMAHTPSSADSY